MTRWLGMAAALGLAAAAGAQETNAAAAMMRSLGGGLTGKKLAQAIDKAATRPLGSRDNPVRVDMPEGERAYLRGLRCAEGAAPGFDRVGSVGAGPYGYILDAYRVTCPGAAAVTVFMDMYHRHVEAAPITGFTVARPDEATI